MQTDNQQANVVPEEIKRKFDDTLTRHMEQSIGANHGLAGLSLDMTTVSCLVVLSEREIERESFPSDPPERFTLETFVEELEEMGLEDHEAVRQKVKEMLDNGYIHTESDGKFLAGKPAIDMANLLDKAFPGMPGMNLVAYLVQTLDEVLSGRKDPDFAATQLAQTLKIHGGGLSQKRSQAKQVPTPQNVLDGKEKEQSAQALRSALSASLRKRQAQQNAYGSVDATGQPRIVTACGAVKAVQVKEIFPKQTQNFETLKEPSENQSVPGSTALEELEGAQEHETPSEVAVDTQAQDVVEDSQKPSGTTPETGGIDLATIEAPGLVSVETNRAEQEVLGQVSSSTLAEAMAQKGDCASAVSAEERSAEEAHGEVKGYSQGSLERAATEQQDMTLPSEEDLESRIAAFEQDLAMTCPVCNRGKIETKETAKGKTFYVCTQQDCVFVSWGKPFHLECPRCKNPFLIEATAKAGKTILRCPRATCRYQQGLPGDEDGLLGQSPETAQGITPLPNRVRRSGKKKRVVRRRVVRRKR